MKSYKLSFGIIIFIQNNLAEVIVNEGVVMDEVKVDEFHDFLLSNLQAPFHLLINKKHSYTYTFEAQKVIVDLEKLKSVAVIAKSSGAVMSTETLMNVNGNAYHNIKLFQERDEALIWLDEQ